MKKKTKKKYVPRSVLLHRFLFHFLHSRLGEMDYPITFEFDSYSSNNGGKPRDVTEFVTPKELRLLYREIFTDRFPREEPAESTPERPPKIEVEKGPKPLPPYTGPGARSRSTRGLSRVVGFSGTVKIQPKSNKYKDILKWIERMRDRWENKGRYLTCPALQGAILQSNNSSSDAHLISNKIGVILADEMEWNHRQVEGMIAASGRNISETKGTSRKGRAEKDKFGNRVGTKAAKINEILTGKAHSADWIRKKAGIEGNVHSHLNFLVKEKKVKRVWTTVNGERQARYRLRKGVS